MPSLTNLIERHLNQLMRLSGGHLIEIQRNELAQQFDCAPSQINYVLSTRFTMEKGYVVESRRGGGGFVRICKVPSDSGDSDLVNEVVSILGDRISGRNALAVLERLLEEKIITQREEAMIKAIMGRNVLRIGLPAREQLRAQILKTILITLMLNLEQNEQYEKQFDK